MAEMGNASLQPQVKRNPDQLQRQQRQRKREEGEGDEDGTDHEGGSPERGMWTLISRAFTGYDRRGQKP
ncbi:MAG: hypothetical protein ACXU89_19415 [Xanthobacteraceae bacterium]